MLTGERVDRVSPSTPLSLCQTLDVELLLLLLLGVEDRDVLYCTALHCIVVPLRRSWGFFSRTDSVLYATPTPSSSSFMDMAIWNHQQTIRFYWVVFGGLEACDLWPFDDEKSCEKDDAV